MQPPLLALGTALLLAGVSVARSAAPAAAFDIRDYGAGGDGVIVNTTAVQKAIDACSAAGGGEVLIAGGNFVIGTIYLKDNVTLHLAAGAALLGSTQIADYATDTHKNAYADESHMFTNLVMQNVPRPVFLTFNSWRMGVDTPDPPPPPKQVRGLTFSNFRIDNSGLADTPCCIVVNGVPGHPIEDVVFDNIAFTLPGGGTPGQAARRDIPDLVNRRPEFGVFGKEIPFAGFYLRHARGLVLRDIDLRAARPEARPALLCDDVADLDATGLRVGAGFAGLLPVR